MDPSSVSCSYNVCLAMFEWSWHHLRIHSTSKAWQRSLIASWRLRLQSMPFLLDNHPISCLSSASYVQRWPAYGRCSTLLTGVMEDLPHLVVALLALHPLNLHQICAGTTLVLVMLPENADHHVPRRETLRPATDGDRCRWPNPL